MTEKTDIAIMLMHSVKMLIKYSNLHAIRPFHRLRAVNQIVQVNHHVSDTRTTSGLTLSYLLGVAPVTYIRLIVPVQLDLNSMKENIRLKKRKT